MNPASMTPEQVAAAIAHLQAQPAAGAPAVVAQPQAQPAAGGWAQTIARGEVNSGGGDYFEAGHYVVDLNGIKIVPSRDPKKPPCDFFVVETRVIETDVPSATAGDMRSYAVALTSPWRIGDVKAFIALLISAKLGKEIATIPEDELVQILQAAASPSNPFLGQRLYLSAQPKVAQNGNAWTKHSWEAMQPGELRGLRPATGAAVATMPAAPDQAALLAQLVAAQGAGQ